ncbi:NAD(P)H-dependent oxidoreductase [Rhodobacteraceae bacterium NNCM2]|nr:NAD(P)H-dependent oxidoreductase [Coraliihabitans acroporae]
MKVLVVYTHPVKKSFNRAILGAVEEGLAEAGHEVRIADLYAEGFQPAMTEEDFAQFQNRPMPEDVLREQARVEWSDAIVFVFPFWWWSLPAMLKGWIDRVMSYGWAWIDPSDPEAGYLKDRKLLVLTTAGASAAALAKRGYDTAFHTQLHVGICEYCGFRDVTSRMFHDLHDETPASVREGYLAEARKLARTFLE